ncbi:membrane protein [Streptomyces phage Enygma]
MSWVYIFGGVGVGLVLGFVAGCYALFWGFLEGLTNIDGPPKLGWYGEWQIRRANKKHQKQKGK